VDLAAAGRFDIGPAWILKRAMADAATAPAVNGSLPAHFSYLDEMLAGASVRTADVAPLPREPAGLVRLGRALEARGESWYEALTYGGKLISTAGSAWRSWKRLRIPSVVRHAYETGYQAVPVVAVIAFLISVISAYMPFAISRSELPRTGGTRT
jgi:phospholipid/cholesterol/gamma-HCH transport system permease protein